jgi:hypothetical protein
MRLYAFAAIMTLLGSLPANAQDIAATIEPNSAFGKTVCVGGPSYFVNAVTGQSREIGVAVSVQNYRLLLNAETLLSLLNRAAAAGFAQCPADIAVAVFIRTAGDPRLAIGFTGQPLVTAWQYQSDRQWKIVLNNVPELVRQEDARKAVSTARVQLFAKFVSDFGVTAGVGPETLAANPFAYKGKTVSVRTTFDKMVSENEAFFGNIFVSNVPSATFTTPGMPVLLAIRIEGLTKAQNGLGVEVSIPSGTYVGSYLCKQPDCLDIIPADTVR